MLLHQLIQCENFTHHEHNSVDSMFTQQTLKIWTSRSVIWYTGEVKHFLHDSMEIFGCMWMKWNGFGCAKQTEWTIFMWILWKISTNSSSICRFSRNSREYLFEWLEFSCPTPSAATSSSSSSELQQQQHHQPVMKMEREKNLISKPYVTIHGGLWKPIERLICSILCSGSLMQSMKGWWWAWHGERENLIATFKVQCNWYSIYNIISCIVPESNQWM